MRDKQPMQTMEKSHKVYTKVHTSDITKELREFQKEVKDFCNETKQKLANLKKKLGNCSMNCNAWPHALRQPRKEQKTQKSEKLFDGDNKIFDIRCKRD